MSSLQTKNYKLKTMRGFTLIEALLYLALFSMLISSAVLVAWSFAEASARTEKALAIAEEASFVGRKISWALAGASSAVTGANGTVLQIDRPDLPDQSPIVFASDGVSVSITRSTGAPVPLTSGDFVVNDGHFITSQFSNATQVIASFSLNGTQFSFTNFIH